MFILCIHSYDIEKVIFLLKNNKNKFLWKLARCSIMISFHVEQPKNQQEV